MIEKIPFGRTGHDSSRVIFGAAALGAMRQEKADRVLELLFEFGINHLDCAASYGDAELRLAPFLADHRSEFFLATKTHHRSASEARRSVEHSLERMGVEQIDLIQLHNLVDEAEWTEALGDGGALEALVQARDEGLVRFIGVTGHGTRVSEMHLRSLERFPFDSVLAPCNHTMLANPEYGADFARLASVCEERGVAIQTIKSISERRWQDADGERRFSWYKPLRDPDAIRRAVAFVLSRPRHFLNTSSDATLLRPILDAASGDTDSAPSEEELLGDVARFGIEPLFIRGAAEGVG